MERGEEINYEIVSNLSNKMKIAVDKKNASEREKIKEKQRRGLQNLCTYGLDFIRFVDYEMNEKSITIHLAEPAVLKLAQRVLSRSGVYDQLLDYGTYGKIGSYFLTILTIKNVELDQEPVFPVAFLVHEKNETSTHLEFWTRIVLKHLNYPVPITVAKDQNIQSAVLQCLADSPSSKLFFCSNKIRQDANQFTKNVKTKSILYKGDDDYKEENFFIAIENLVSCETLDKFNETLEEFSGAWSQKYLSYFSQKIQPLILSNLLRKKASNLKMNAPEHRKYELDFHLPDNENSFCLTDLILRLQRQSCELVIEFNRFYNSREPNGLYKLKYKFIAYLKNMAIESKYLDYLDESKKQNSLSCLTMFAPSVFSLFHFQIADLVINNDLIHLDVPSNSYVVRSPFNETTHRVYDKGGKTTCTCTLPDVCFHKIAAKFVYESKQIAANSGEWQ